MPQQYFAARKYECHANPSSNKNGGRRPSPAGHQAIQPLAGNWYVLTNKQQRGERISNRISFYSWNIWRRTPFYLHRILLVGCSSSIGIIRHVPTDISEFKYNSFIPAKKISESKCVEVPCRNTVHIKDKKPVSPVAEMKELQWD